MDFIVGLVGVGWLVLGAMWVIGKVAKWLSPQTAPRIEDPKGFLRIKPKRRPGLVAVIVDTLTGQAKEIPNLHLAHRTRPKDPRTN